MALNINPLPSGKVRIHLLIKDEAGPIYFGPAELGPDKIKVEGFSWRTACAPGEPWRGGPAPIGAHYTSEPAAATCPECLKAGG